MISIDVSGLKGATGAPPPSSGGGFTPVDTSQPVAAQAPAPAPAQSSGPNLGQLDAKALLSGAENIWGAVKNAASRFAGQKTASQAQPEGIGTAFGQELAKAGDLVEGGLGAASGAVQSVFAPVSATVQRLQNGASNNPTVQKIAMSPLVSSVLDAANNAQHPLNQWAQQNPRAAQDLGNTLNVALGVAGGEAPAVDASAGDVANSIQDAFNNASELDKTGKAQYAAQKPNIKEPMMAQVENYVKANIKNAWEAPGKRMQEPRFNKARAVLNASPDVPQFLANLKINPSAHIEDGSYATADTASALRQDAGQISSTMLRPGLQMADYSVGKTPVSDIVKKAIDFAQSSKTSTAGDISAQIRRIKQEGATLEKKFPEGMTLTNMHDNGITYNQNAGFKAYSSNLDNNIASANHAMGNALKTTVADKAPEGLPVKAVNQELSKYYKAADYLDALNGKKVPKSIIQKMGMHAGQLGGALIGSALGGGILADVAGYQLGGAVARGIESMSNPLRSLFLRNLEVTNPEAFRQVSEYLKNPNTGQLALPEGSNPNNAAPIIMGAGKDRSGPIEGQTSIAPYAAKAPTPGRSPQTGRMVRVYSSKPKS